VRLALAQLVVMDKLTKKEKSDRLIEAAMAILQATPQKKLNIVQLNKALFYLDLYSLRDTGKTITQNTYVALPLGPVVADYPKHLVKELEKRELAVQTNEGDSKPVHVRAEIVDFQYLNDDARQLADEIGREIAKKTSSALSEFSHENVGWRLAREDGKPKPIDMRVALQQLADEDPWLSEAPDAGLHDKLLSAKKTGTAW
jgi:hypothetical protein